MARRPYTKTEQVQTTLTEVDRRRLDAYAEARKVSRADAIRQLVLGGLEREEKPLTWDCCGVAIGDPHAVNCYTGFGRP